MQWMWLNNGKSAPAVLFRCEFYSDGKNETAFDYSADENCQLFVDGKIVSYGVETGSPERWYFDRFARKFAQGRHILVARVWVSGKDNKAPAYQLSVRNGFYCTLPGQWECMAMPGIRFEVPWPDWGSFPRFHADKNYSDSLLAGQGGSWEPAAFFEDDRPLFPPELPPQRDELCKKFHYDGKKFIFDEYVCVNCEYTFSGKGTAKIRWSETPYLTSAFNRHNLKGEKGRRDGAFFVGDFDTIAVNGKTRWVDFTWRAGKYLEIQTTGTVKVEKISCRHTGYPYPDVLFPRGKWKKTLEMAKRTLECCSHTTFMDCPFYERMQYIGDSRCEALALYALDGDPALVRKALRQTVIAQKADGQIPCRYPCKVDSTIPSFIPVWLLMMHDYWKNTGDVELVRELHKYMLNISGFFQKSIGEDGLLYLPGWMFIDWQWPLRGVPFGGECGTNSIINLLVVLAWQKLAEMEAACQDKSNSELHKKLAAELLGKIKENFFDPQSSLMADDKNQMFYSEHAQSLALLCEPGNEAFARGLRTGKFFTKCGIYFSSYYLEACEACGAWDLAEKRLNEYLELPALGLSTFPEEFTAPRSDCHAWGAHVLWHFRQLTGKPYQKK